MDDFDFPENSVLGSQIALAAEEDDAEKAETLIRANEFLVLQMLETDECEGELHEEEQFAVLLAEVEDDLAVVCFSDSTSAENFMDQVCDDLAGGQRLPAVLIDGNQLLDELPESIGLLVNPTTGDECYFPPSCFDAGATEDSDEYDHDEEDSYDRDEDG